MSTLSLPKQQADVTFQGIICAECGAPVVEYDSGSSRYEDIYGIPLKPICDECLDEIFFHAKRHGRSE